MSAEIDVSSVMKWHQGCNNAQSRSPSLSKSITQLQAPCVPSQPYFTRATVSLLSRNPSFLYFSRADHFQDAEPYQRSLQN
jgi:hypothetical protein